MDAELPPGPRWPAPVLGALMMVAPRYLRHCRRRYGDIFTMDLGRWGRVVYLCDPADIKTVFHGDDTVFHAGEANATVLERVLGPTSVLVTDEELHRKQRRRLAGPFHGESIARLVPVMQEVAAADVRTWPVGRKLRLLPRTRAITLDVILRTVLGVEDDTRRQQLRVALRALVNISVLQVMQFALPGLSRFWPWTRFRPLEDRANRLLRAEIERCSQDPALAERTDVLAMMVRHVDEDGSRMSPDEMRDQLVTLLLAGHETTATGLAWTFERLVRHPEVLARATAAARAGDDAYLNAVVEESLRARPVVPDVSRRLTVDVALHGYNLPAGTFVDPAILLVHRSTGHYPDADRFDPGRFVGSRPDPSVWIPFGGGNRRCLGAAFAATEMRVVLAEVLKRVELETTTSPGERTRMRHVTLTPHAGGRVRVVARHRAPVALAPSPMAP